MRASASTSAMPALAALTLQRFDRGRERARPDAASPSPCERGSRPPCGDEQRERRSQPGSRTGRAAPSPERERCALRPVEHLQDAEHRSSCRSGTAISPFGTYPVPRRRRARSADRSGRPRGRAASATRAPSRRSRSRTACACRRAPARRRPRGRRRRARPSPRRRGRSTTPRAEDRAGDHHDRAQEERELVLRRQDAGRDRCVADRRAQARASSPTLFEIRYSTVFSWNGVSRGCLPSTSAAMPAMAGVAKLLPVARIVPPPSHATSTSTPRAKNSTGGFGFA